MTAAAFIAALVVPLAAAHTYVLDLSERSELRVRSPGDSLDLEQLARAHLELRMPRARFGFGYQPRFSVTDVVSDATFDLLHTGEVTGDFEWRKVSLSLSERVSYGTRSFTSLTASTFDVVDAGAAPSGTSAANTPGNQPQQTIVPVAADIGYASADSSARIGIELSQRWQLTLSGGYLVDGGIEQRDRRVIPWAYGPRGAIEVRHQLLRRDSLGTVVEGESYHTDIGSGGGDLRADIVRAYESWSHRFSQRTSSEVTAGAAWSQRDPTPEETTDLYPIGSAALQHVVPLAGRRETLELDGSGRVTVIVDRLTGIPDQRLDLNLGATWSRDPYQVYGTLGRTQSLQSAQENSLVLYSGEVGGRYQWTRPVLVEAGYRLAYQDIDNTTTSAASVAASGFNWLLFMALQVTAEPLDF